MPKAKELSAGAKRALAILQENEGSMTLAEIKEAFPEANSSHLTALKNRGLVSTETVVKEVETIVKRKVNAYSALNTEPTE